MLIKARAIPKRGRKMWASLYLLAFAFAVPISIMADTVSGRVYGQDGKACVKRDVHRIHAGISFAPGDKADIIRN
jgi:hypothetical protein